MLCMHTCFYPHVLSPGMLSVAGLAGAAPCGTSLVPDWTWSPWCLSRKVSYEPPCPTAPCQPLCSPAVGCWGGCKCAQMHFPCLSCSTELMETPQEARGSCAHPHLRFSSQGMVMCGAQSSNTKEPNPNLPSSRTGKCSRGMCSQVIKKKLKIEAAGSPEAYGHFGKQVPRGCVPVLHQTSWGKVCKKFMTCSIKNVFSALNVLYHTNGQYQLDLCWERCGLSSVQANLHLSQCQ